MTDPTSGRITFAVELILDDAGEYAALLLVGSHDMAVLYAAHAVEHLIELNSSAQTVAIDAVADLPNIAPGWEQYDYIIGFAAIDQAFHEVIRIMQAEGHASVAGLN